MIQRLARLSIKSRSRHLLASLEWSRSRHPWNFWVSMSLGLDIPKISESLWVSVSTSTYLLVLDESRSRHLPIFWVLMSLDLDIHQNSQSRWVSVSTTTKIISLNKSRSRHLPSPSLDISWKLENTYIPLLVLGATHKEAINTNNKFHEPGPELPIWPQLIKFSI